MDKAGSPTPPSRPAGTVHRHFALERETQTLPPGAYAHPARTLLRADGRALLGFTQGSYRSYLHPVFTPRGFCVTGEHPVDHPHHAGIWIAADRVSWWPNPGPDEEHTYNFYVDEVFQGRAPGRILSTGLELGAGAQNRVEVKESCVWRGPGEWGAPRGREIAREQRSVTVGLAKRWHTIDITSVLTPCGGRLRIGPTRHAWFSGRLADVAVVGGARLSVSRQGENHAPLWIDLSGPAGGGQRVGLAVIRPGDQDPVEWFAKTWGIVTLQPYVHAPEEIPMGETRRQAARFVVHDGDIGAEALDALAESFRTKLGKENS